MTPLDERVLAAGAGAGSPLALVPYRHRRVADGVVQPAAALRLQAGAGEQGQVAEAVLFEVHRNDTCRKGGKAKQSEVNPGLTYRLSTSGTAAPSCFSGPSH